MVPRRPRKRKGTSHSGSFRQRNKRKTTNYSENRLHKHPYKTRSKSFRETETTTDPIESFIPSRRSSDSSVIYLGSFRKSPQLVTLEDSNESFPEKIIQQETWLAPCQRQEII
ncbi:hypothetical protein PUN28_007895 [Cardiocondyla obscurior]|uniref:Uncharacterized protein n=1 Tax=Cardiocondyla obscurior TaxID=286306 RepID=A0AAW2FZW6_9HYME